MQNVYKRLQTLFGIQKIYVYISKNTQIFR